MSSRSLPKPCLEHIADSDPRELAERLRLALDSFHAGEWTWDADTDAMSLSPVACEIFGLATGTAITWTAMQRDLLHPQDAPTAAKAVCDAIAAGGLYRTEYRSRRPSDGEVVWILASGQVRRDASGQVVGMIGIVQDITARKHEQIALSEEAQALDTLNRTGALVASELDLEKCVQAVTDAGVEIVGAQFGAFFYNVIAPSGEQYMLYTLSGAPREAFSRFPMPRNTPVFAPTFTGAGIVRSDDITKDPRYGTMEPHRGMPVGHLPVRSYPAVPVISRAGEVIGGLFFGHGVPGKFEARHERVMKGIAAQAAIAIDNARLYQRSQRELEEKRKAEDAMRALAEALEVRVKDRTAELENANAQLVKEIEERQRIEEALRHAQKLEAIGQLTGGVAHDFNNLLTVVIGNLDVLSRRVGEEADIRIRRAVENALEGSRRAASLTQRLLAFARRQPLDPKPSDPNRLVQSMTELLHRTLGETIEVETVLGAGVWPVEVDHGQLESALLNLAVNARDAMPHGGKLTIETTNTHIDEAYGRAHGLVPGQYIVICVSDTGCGIPVHLIDSVIEPFFTTKPAGHGTASA